MSEEKRNSEAEEERPPDRGGSKSAAERRSEERRAARERAANEAGERKPVAKSRKPAPKPKPAPSPKERPVSKAREQREREAGKQRPSPATRPRRRPSPHKPSPRPEGPGPARLYALLAGALLSLLGVVGFLYDSSFDTGADLASDDLAGVLMVNGWRNVVYLVTGLAALAFAPRRPRATALALGLFYLVSAGWGFIATERGIGDILDLLPLSNEDNVFHLLLAALGLLAALVDGPLPKLPEGVRERLRPPKRKPRPKRSASGTRRRPGERKPAPRPVAKKPIEKKSPSREPAEKKPARKTDSS